MNKLIFIAPVFMLLSCSKEKLFDGPDSYEDGFESYEHFDSLFVGDDVYWSHSQITKEGNAISVDTTIVHSGSRSMKFTAVKTEDGASKASISKQKMAFWEGETVSLEAWYYLVGTESLDWIVLMDLEEQAVIGAGPGMRLILVDNHLAIDHKFPNNNLYQDFESGIDFPRDQWVNIRFETKLSQKKKGYVKIYQDDVLVLEGSNRKTMPSDLLYATQGTKGIYQSIEFGITANSFEREATLYVDDVKAEVLP
ncbi:heparin lyase I family protein [Crocinitomix catalasitica]|nr:heparin lyase I family protein [Crocinitomix catalasitica]